MLLKALPLLALAACHGGRGKVVGSCPGFVAGDLSLPIELLPFASESGALIKDGDPVRLQRPSQGGFVIDVGARVRNLQACGLSVGAQLIDPATGKSLTELDLRQGDFTALLDGYFVSPAGDGEPNIPACPNYLGQTINGKKATLQIRVRDAQGRSTAVERSVTPACDAGDGACAIVCGPH